MKSEWTVTLYANDTFTHNGGPCIVATDYNNPALQGYGRTSEEADAMLVKVRKVHEEAEG